MKITLLTKPGFSGNMLVRKIQEVAKSQLLNIDVFLNEHLQEADVVLLTPQRNEDLKEIKKIVKVPVGVISLRDYGLLDGSSIIKQAKQLIQKQNELFFMTFVIFTYMTKIIKIKVIVEGKSCFFLRTEL